MDERIERQRTIVAERLALENAHQWDAVAASFTAAAPSFELKPAGATLECERVYFDNAGVFAEMRGELTV